MATFQQRKDPMRLMWRRILVVLLLVLIAVAARGVWGVYQKEKVSRELKIEAQAKLGNLQERENELRSEIAALRSQKGVEAELRERYDLAAAGESVVVIVDPLPSPSEPEPTRLQRLKSWFVW